MTRLNILPENPEKETVGRFPSWLHRKLPQGMTLAKTRSSIETKRLHTVCEEAHCPNVGECWQHGTATFMILGDVCTRNCAYCAVSHGRPPAYDIEEPQRVAQAIGPAARELQQALLELIGVDVRWDALRRAQGEQ